ncbi:MAG: hypothetical protein EXS16_13600 [Gemmataceae bacterium]|nr:hypothetical protein [Gemmataceae bacterium]
MSLQDSFMFVVKKYGGVAKFVTTTVLNVIAPGSSALVQLVEQVFDKGKDVAQHHWEAKLLEATQANADELQRLGQLFDLLNGELAFAVNEQSTNIEAIVRQAIATDATLRAGLRKLDALLDDFDCIKKQQCNLLEGQHEMLPIMRRLQNVMPFLEACQQAQADPRELLMVRQAILLNIQLRQPQLARAAVKQLEAVGKRGDTHLFKAGIALIDHDYPSVQSELGEVVRQHPHDKELGELHRRATVIATGVTPRVAPPLSVAHASGSVNPEVGDVLDGWTLTARLGAGGWGQVFKATHGTETVALKIMHARYSQDKDFVKRFRGEIAALMRLPIHTNLLRYLDFNFERDCRYLVTEYIDGPTLDRHLQNKGPLSSELAQNVFAPVTDGLAQVHAAGIVHRDIKPSNLVFRTKDQKLVLVDFGLAVQNANVGKTQIGGVTLMFGSPEQTRGLPADARGDVYSLAATIWFALLHDKPDRRNPIHFDADEIPLALRAALARAMETNPKKRFADGREFHAALTSSACLAAEARLHADQKRKQQEEGRLLAEQVQQQEAASLRAEQERKQREQVEAIRRQTELARHLEEARLHAEQEKEQQTLRLNAKSGSFAVFCPHCTRCVTLLNDKSGQVTSCPLCNKQFKAPTLAPSPTANPKNNCGDLITNTRGMKFAYIPPGDFIMGSPTDEEGRFNDETQHKVILTTAYYLGVTPVTRGQFAEFVRVTGHKTPGGAYTWNGKEWKDDPKADWRNPGFQQTTSIPSFA